MKNKTEMICILGGLYFVFGYIFDQLQILFASMQLNNLWAFVASCFDYLSTACFGLFVILFFMLLFGKKISFLQKFADRFPKLAVYAYYVGFVGYILLAFDLIVLAPMEFISLSETTQKYIVWSVGGINIAGILIAIALATRQVFGKHIKK